MKLQRGMSLIEVVLALVIVALAVPPLVFQIAGSAQQQQRLLVQRNLTRLASERLTAILADHANPTRGFVYIENANYPDETEPGGLSGYARRTEVRAVNPADFLTELPGSDVKRIRITTSGPDEATLVIETFATNIPGAAAE